MTVRSLLLAAFSALSLGLPAASSAALAGDVREVRLDWATYNPLSLVLKQQGLVEKAFAKEGVTVRWVQSRGSAAYKKARGWSLAHPAEFKALVAKETGLAAAVVDRQIDHRTDLSRSAIGDAQLKSILSAGLALQKAGVVPASTDVKGALDALIDTRFEPPSR